MTIDKKYLPSTQFRARVLIILIIIGLVFGITEISRFIKKKVATKRGEVDTLIVKDLVLQDSNTNGIPDWEESLWGLDPYLNGPENKAFILAKREALEKDTSVPLFTDEGIDSKENEALSKEFFAVIMSLQQTGNLNEGTLNAVNEAIGQKIVAEPIADVYSRDMVKIAEADEDGFEIITYFTDYTNLNIKYSKSNLGDELFFVETALNNNDKAALALVSKIADSYRNYSKDLIKLSVPLDMVDAHVSLANNYEKVAQSIYDLTKLFSNPIVGMKGIINYNRYSQALVLDIDKLSTKLE